MFFTIFSGRRAQIAELRKNAISPLGLSYDKETRKSPPTHQQTEVE